MKNDTKKQAAKKNQPNPKEVAIQFIAELHKKVLHQATAAIKARPEKSAIIAKARDIDLARIQYTINLLKVKM